MQNSCIGFQKPDPEIPNPIPYLREIDTVFKSTIPERYALVALFIIAVGGMPILENPVSSLIMSHDRMVWLVKTLRRHNITVSQH